MQRAGRRDGKTRLRPMATNSKPNYGIDAPGAVCSFFIAGAISTIAGLFVPSFALGGFSISLVGPTLLAIGMLSLLLGGSMLAYSLRGKFNVRDRMLGLYNWKGDEAVLDIGTGSGLLAIGAAKRLTSGTVTGIDLWDDGKNNKTIESTLRNIAIEKVEDKVEIKNDDARNISFLDNSFDVILSLSCLHSIHSSEDRDSVCHEIARVLKRGGSAIIADYTDISEYTKAFAKTRTRVEKRRSIAHIAYTPMSILIIKKM